ncbi:MAG: cohesin domain-containing protein, partial [Acidimicrobiales bacterium]
KMGETGTVSVVGLGAVGLTGVQLVVTYDPAVIEALDVRPGSLLTLDGVSVQAERNLEPGRVRARFTRETPATGSGALATIQLKPLSAGASSLGFGSLAITTSAGDERPAPPVCRIEVAP